MTLDVGQIGSGNKVTVYSKTFNKDTIVTLEGRIAFDEKSNSGGFRILSIFVDDVEMMSTRANANTAVNGWNIMNIYLHKLIRNGSTLKVDITQTSGVTKTIYSNIYSNIK